MLASRSPKISRVSVSSCVNALYNFINADICLKMYHNLFLWMSIDKTNVLIQTIKIQNIYIVKKKKLRKNINFINFLATQLKLFVTQNLVATLKLRNTALFAYAILTLTDFPILSSAKLFFGRSRHFRCSDFQIIVRSGLFHVCHIFNYSIFFVFFSTSWNTLMVFVVVRKGPVLTLREPVIFLQF